MLKPALIALAAVAALASPAAARPGSDVTTDYYADAAKTQWVGSTELTCGGGFIRYGRRSAYFTRTSDPCGRARFDKARLQSFARLKADPLTQCRSACERKYHGPPQLCTPDGCPQQADLQQCMDTCTDTFGPGAGARR